MSGDGTAYLTFYLDEEEDVAPVLMNVRKELEDMRAFLDVVMMLLQSGIIP